MGQSKSGEEFSCAVLLADHMVEAFMPSVLQFHHLQRKYNGTYHRRSTKRAQLKEDIMVSDGMSKG